jgi:hypothetical protein
MRISDVVAEWDDEARVWVASSDDIPGLITEAETREQLVTRLRTLVPELLRLNAHLMPHADGREFCIHWKEEQRVAYA